MTRPFTLIAALIFALMALIHVYRLFTDFQVVLGSHVIPMWASYVAIVVAGGLAIGLYRDSR
jgi:TRAP-type C4-dicarboxylate transport system permease small subunit